MCSNLEKQHIKEYIVIIIIILIKYYSNITIITSIIIRYYSISLI